ncbi:MAG: tetrahydromethanopterin S-methyltransferase subunit H [Candidatus Lokiarchaeota archaeon]|nr:tetrahydromethanopterin S-methyltransferase subunit H [Candidatus Lokiarchaeota archaeon]
MFKYDKEQEIYDIAGVKLGGQPGQLPTVLFGSIFYYGHDIVKDAKKGEFDKEKAQQLIKTAEELSDQTGNPLILDVCCSWSGTFEKLIDFVANNSDNPFAIDGTTAKIKMTGARYAKDVGLSSRIVYNSIMPDANKDEIAVIKESEIETAILLSLNTTKPTLAGRMEVMDDLLSISREAGITKPIVDTTVIDKPDIGPISKVIHMVKEKYGIPTGAGVHNAVARWAEMSDLSPKKQFLASAVANSFPIAFGADFLLYGPIDQSEEAFFTSSLADAYVAFNARQEFRLRPLTNEHPLMKIFRT